MTIELTQSQKIKLIEDIRNDCSGCGREMAYEYISQGVLTKEELVDIYHLLTPTAYNHILKYPSRMYEVDPMPPIPYDDDTNDFIIPIIPNDIDVLFFGVPGSGGKTCLMASLMTLVDKRKNFTFRPNTIHNNAYAHYLSSILTTNRLPPGTDMCYIQAANTLLRCDNVERGVSFIEFPGEYVMDIAGHTLDEGLRGGNISPRLKTILDDSNKKILFICYDPTNSKTLLLDSPDSPDGHLWVSQSDVLSCVVSLMKKDSQFMKNVIAIHFVITKSDKWLKYSLEKSIANVVKDGECSLLFSEINELALKYKINKHLNYKVDPIPFTIGKFMMGDTYEFNDSDAKKILKLIEEDIVAYNNNKSKLRKFGLKLTQLFNT